MRKRFKNRFRYPNNIMSDILNTAYKLTMKQEAQYKVELEKIRQKYPVEVNITEIYYRSQFATPTYIDGNRIIPYSDLATAVKLVIDELSNEDVIANILAGFTPEISLSDFKKKKKCDKEYIPLSYVGLSSRTYNWLTEVHFYTLGSVADYINNYKKSFSADYWYRDMKNFGHQSAKEITDILIAYGFTLQEPYALNYPSECKSNYTKMKKVSFDIMKDMLQEFKDSGLTPEEWLKLK